MNTEYVRNLHSNYERLLLEEKPEEKKYQYCILNRGGIKGLLPCSLRYLDGAAYLYYDITSKQNIVLLHQKGKVDREWLMDFLESIRRLQQELGRFLLQEKNVLWEPEQIFQDLESNVFSFLYVPYYTGENQFLRLLGFLVEKIDYEDEILVECVYKMYEQMERNGEVYLQEQIFKDAEMLENAEKKKQPRVIRTLEQASETVCLPAPAPEEAENSKGGREALGEEDSGETAGQNSRLADVSEKESVSPKKLFGLFENKRAKRTAEQEIREEYRRNMQKMVDGYAVAEDAQYGEEYGRTVFMTERPDKKEIRHRLYYSDGRKASELEVSNLLIGKYKDKVDIYLEDDSVSRMHARVLKDQGAFYLEDSNSTNGTFLNKQRLQPYERKKLEEGDEIRCGNVVLFFR